MNTAKEQCGFHDLLSDLKFLLTTEEYDLDTFKRQLQIPVSNFCEKTLTVQGNSLNWNMYAMPNLFHDMIGGLNELKSQYIQQRVINRKLTTKYRLKGDLKHSFSITYFAYQERLTDVHALFTENILIRDNPRVICAVVKGNQVIVELSTTDRTNQRKLASLVELIRTKKKIPEYIDLSGIVYSVSGRIPLNYHVDTFTLTRKNLNSLLCFMSEEFYVTIIDREIMEITTVPVNLENYFRPIVEKLVELQCIATDPTFTKYVKVMISILIRESLQAIEKCAMKIKSGEKCADYIRNLQNLYKSYLLNKEELANFLVELETIANSKKFNETLVKSFSTSTSIRKRLYDKNCKLSVQYNVHISLNEALNLLSKTIKQFLNNNAVVINMVKMKHQYSDAISHEWCTATRQLESYEQGRFVLEDYLKKNININFKCDVSDSLQRTITNVQLIKYGTEYFPSYPLLDRPRNIRMIEAFENEIVIEWDFPDDSDVTCYRIEYRKSLHNTDDTTNTNSSSLRWCYFMTEDNAKGTSLKDIASGDYVCKIQACFRNYFGAPSEESKLFSTLDDKILCKICFEERKQVVIVPCGHTLCKSCAEKLSVSCPNCREQITKVTKLFYD